MSRETTEQKARRYIAEGRLRVVHVQGDLVAAECRGEQPYNVRLAAGTWRCSCPARTARCAHVLAAELVTVPFRSLHELGGRQARNPNDQQEHPEDPERAVRT